MRNGRFYTSKCRGRFKNGGAIHASPPRSPGPYYMQGPLLKNIKKECDKKNKNLGDLIGRTGPRPSWLPFWGRPSFGIAPKGGCL
jgi:hypothetical protein